MKKFTNSKDLDDAIKSGEVKPSETVLLDERETTGISNNLDLISENNRKADGRADFLEGYHKSKKEVLELINNFDWFEKDLEWEDILEKLKQEIKGK